MTGVEVAGNWRRLSAYMVDHLLLGLLWAPVAIQVFSTWITYPRSNEIVIEWRWLISCFALQFCYRVFFLKFLGATVGKILFGIRVVPRANPEGRLSWMQSILRVLTEHLSLFFGWGPAMLALLRFDRTHIADWVAETRVVQLTPRLSPPRRHLFWGIFLTIYFSISGFLSAYYLIQRTDFSTNQIKVHRIIPSEY